MLRRTRVAVGLAVASAVAMLSAGVFGSWSESSPGLDGWTQTPHGPVGPADRDLLVKIRGTGLWEMPSAQQAVQQASRPEVQQVARTILVERGGLDGRVREVAGRLGVPLPIVPSDRHVGWMAEITAETGPNYDRVLVQRLRETDGDLLPVVARVRSSTRNDLVRELATDAEAMIARHQEYLEGTGLVDYGALPYSGPGLLSGGTEPKDLVLPMGVFAAAVLGAVALVPAMRRRTPGRRIPAGAPPRGGVDVASPAPDVARADTGPIDGRSGVAAPSRAAPPGSVVAGLRGSISSYRNARPPSGVRLAFTVLATVMIIGPIAQVLSLASGARVLAGTGLPDETPIAVVVWGLVGMLLLLVVGMVVLLKMRAGQRWARNASVVIAAVALGFTLLGLAQMLAPYPSGVTGAGLSPDAGRLGLQAAQVILLLAAIVLMHRPFSAGYFR
jgi:predicted outer membrane protein